MRGYQGQIDFVSNLDFDYFGIIHSTFMGCLSVCLFVVELPVHLACVHSLLTLLTRLLLDVDTSLGILTGLAIGITPLCVDILLYCFAENDEGVIYEMRY